jgi:iron(III) transport system permease protein
LAHTLQIGAATATLASGGGLALALARGRGRATALAIGAAQAGYALPGTVLALAVVGLVPQLLPWLDGTTGEIVLAVAILTFAPAFQSCATALDTVPRALIDAARGLGESPVRAFWRVVLPLAGPALLSAWALAFGLAARELAATLIVRPPGYDTLAVRIWVHATDIGPDPRAAAVALLLLAVLGVAWGIALWLGRRSHAEA